MSYSNNIYYHRAKYWLLPFINDGPNTIMDIGCASGELGRLILKHKKANILHGVELSYTAAKEAESIYSKIHIGDIESMSIDYASFFDYIICADILEHLKNPSQCLSNIRQWLKPNGKVLICVPNIRYYHVIYNLLLRGDWRYESAGILDRTHLRFFTVKSCKHMIAESNYNIFHRKLIIEGRMKPVINALTLNIFSEFLATQMFFALNKLNHSCST